MSSILAATKAVAFAEDSKHDAFGSFHRQEITANSMWEVLGAYHEVRRIAAGNIQPQESP
jgi:hypothetical protein